MNLSKTGGNLHEIIHICTAVVDESENLLFSSSSWTQKYSLSHRDVHWRSNCAWTGEDKKQNNSIVFHDLQTSQESLTATKIKNDAKTLIFAFIYINVIILLQSEESQFVLSSQILSYPTRFNIVLTSIS